MKDIKGFLSKKEAEKLQELYLNVHNLGYVLEIGTYCVKSALNFASVAEKVNGLVYTIDHHTGSEEHHLGEEYHDKDLFDLRIKKFNTITEFLKNLLSSKIGKFVIPIIENSHNASKIMKKINYDDKKISNLLKKLSK